MGDLWLVIPSTLNFVLLVLLMRRKARLEVHELHILQIITEIKARQARDLHPKDDGLDVPPKHPRSRR